MLQTLQSASVIHRSLLREIHKYNSCYNRVWLGVWRGIIVLYKWGVFDDGSNADTWNNTTEKHMKLKGCHTHRSQRGRHIVPCWFYVGWVPRESEQGPVVKCLIGSRGGKSMRGFHWCIWVSLRSQWGWGKKGNLWQGPNQPGILGVLDCAHHLFVGMLRHQENINLKNFFSTLRNIRNKCTGLWIHIERHLAFCKWFLLDWTHCPSGIIFLKS